jgi:MYXO-CTERM domain-containing protein
MSMLRVRAGDDIELLLAERGHDLAGGRVRVAAGPSGIAVGFPKDPMLHLSWWALLAFALVAGLRRRRRA